MATPAIARLAEEHINKHARRIEQLRSHVAPGGGPLPYTADRADPAHLYLREQSTLPVLAKAVRAVTSRLRVTGYHTVAEDGTAADTAAWQAWTEARMSGRSRGCIEDSVVVGAGVISVWPNAEDPARPHVAVEDPAQCWHEPSETGPGYAWAAKRWSVTETVNPRAPRTVTVEMLTVYEPEEVTVYAKRSGRWVLADLGEAPNPAPSPFDGHLALVQIAPDRDPQGHPRSWAEALVPAARALNTFRFDMLLAGHSAAFRQLFISGYDPVQRDENGLPLWQKHADGTPVLDEHGYPVPVVRSPVAGVDKVVTFTDPNTKLDSVPPVDLDNYTGALDYLITSFAAAAALPPTAVGGSVSQVSGETLEQAAMEQAALVRDFQDALSEDLERVFDLIALAMGTDPEPAEVVWAPSGNRTLAQVATFIGATVPHGVPVSVGLEMLPGVSPETVAGWLADAPTPAAPKQP